MKSGGSKCGVPAPRISCFVPLPRVPRENVTPLEGPGPRGGDILPSCYTGQPLKNVTPLCTGWLLENVTPQAEAEGG